MGKYRKKPVEVEARWFSGQSINGSYELADWCGGSIRLETAEDKRALIPFIDIQTLEGTMTASPDDWIIKGVQGEFYPCKSDIFEATYEAVEQA